MNEGIQIAQRGGLVIADPLVADVPAGLRDLFFPSVPIADLLQHPLHGVLRRRPSNGRGHRPVPPPFSSLDRARLRHPRTERRAPDGGVLGDRRTRGALLRGSADRRPDPGGRRVGPAQSQRRRGLVRAIPQRRDGHAGAAPGRGAGVPAGPRRPAAVLRTDRRCARRAPAVPALRRRSRRGGVRRGRHADARRWAADRLVVLRRARGDERRWARVSERPDAGVFGGLSRLYARLRRAVDCGGRDRGPARVPGARAVGGVERTSAAGRANGAAGRDRCAGHLRLFFPHGGRKPGGVGRRRVPDLRVVRRRPGAPGGGGGHGAA